jgi:uncharacterized protein YggE
MLRLIPLQLALSAYLTLLPISGTTQTKNPAMRQVVTYGTGEIVLPPDRAIIQIAVTSDDSTAAKAAAQNADRFNRVVSALEALGFKRDSLVRISYTVGPNYDWQNASQIKGYRARSVIRLTLGDLNRLAPMIDAALAAGATDIPGIAFESDSADAVRSKALERAVRQARADAVALAASTGTHLGDLLELSTGQDYGYGIRGFQTLQQAFDPADYSGVGTEFASREVVVQVRVAARWRLLPARGR